MNKVKTEGETIAPSLIVVELGTEDYPTLIY